MGDSGRNVLQSHAGYFVLQGWCFQNNVIKSKQVLLKVQAGDCKHNLDFISSRRFFSSKYISALKLHSVN